MNLVGAPIFELGTPCAQGRKAIATECERFFRSRKRSHVEAYGPPSAKRARPTIAPPNPIRTLPLSPPIRCSRFPVHAAVFLTLGDLAGECPLRCSHESLFEDFQRLIFLQPCNTVEVAFSSSAPNQLPETRVVWHNAGHNGHTADDRPWNVVAAIELRTEEAARAFERYLKSGSGRACAKRHFPVHHTGRSMRSEGPSIPATFTVLGSLAGNWEPRSRPSRIRPKISPQTNRPSPSAVYTLH
jgi:hypothetical protein